MPSDHAGPAGAEVTSAATPIAIAKRLAPGDRRRKAAVGRPVLIVAGPTASGKSALALALAERLDGTVINADSMQVYRELAILTGRPDAEALARAPHRLYGVLAARDPCSAGRWRAMALAEIAAAHAAGRLPILCGGSGLYFAALTQGLVELPPVPAALRAEAQALCRRLGTAGLHAALAARDPATAARLRPTDRQRLVRAWEVLEATGRPLAEWQEEATMGPPAELRFAAILLDPPRPQLYTACDRRLDAMIAAGALAELRHFLAESPDPELPLRRAVGVPELARHLAGELSLAAAVALAKQATRRYVKRQVTWFRGHRLARHVLTLTEPLGAQFSERIFDGIFKFIRQFLLTAGN
jgi:tRNA dimethylallyltransferase